MLDYVNDGKLGEVGNESDQHRSMATIKVPNVRGQLSLQVATVLERGSGVSRLSGNVASKLGAHLEGTQVV